MSESIESDEHALFTLTRDEILNLIDIYGSPFYYYDMDQVVKNAKYFIDVFSKKFLGFKQYFACKTLINPNVLKILMSDEIGMGMDTSSSVELEIASKLKCEHIFYTGNFVSVTEMTYALKMYEKNSNIVINLDDIDALDNIKKTGMIIPDTISFRVNPNIDTSTIDIKSNILCGKDSKFGVSIDKIVDAYRIAKEMGSTKFFIHCMTGSNILDENYWNFLIDEIFKIINLLKIELGIEIDAINAGGGIGIPYRPEQKKINIELLSDNIRKKFDENILKYGVKEPRLIFEAGRYITAPYGFFISTCESIKHSYENTYYGISGSMTMMPRCAMYGAYHHISVITSDGRKLSAEKESVKIVGSLCENNDFFSHDFLLNKDIIKGDIFVIHDTGGHCMSMASNYNGKLRPPEIMRYKGELILIRRRETIDDFLWTIV